MPDNYSRRRFELPVEWEPVGTWCVVVRTPADTQYLDQMVGLLDDLTWSKYYQRDDTKIGAATVARTWAAALTVLPPEVIDCAEVVPTPPTPDSESEGDAADAVISGFFIWLIQQVINCIDEAVPVAECVENLITWLGDYGGDTPAVRAMLANIYNQIAALSPAERDEYISDCQWLDEFSELRDEIESNDSWLDQLSQWLFDRLTDLSDTLIANLNYVGGLLTGSGIWGFIASQGWPHSGGGASFGGEECWEARLDFTEQDHGFIPGVHPIYGAVYGIWVEGQGWESLPFNYIPGQGWKSLLIIERTWPTFTLASLTAFVTIEEDDPDHNLDYGAVLSGGWGELTSFTGFDPGNYTQHFEGPHVGCANLVIHGSPNWQDHWLLNGKVTLRKLILRGVGPNPFAP